MSAQYQELIDAQLPNGALVKVGVETSGGAQDVGFRDALSFEHVQRMLSGLAEMVRDAARKAAPSSVELEFGLNFTVEDGKLLGLIINGSTEASMTVKLSWDKNTSTDEDAHSEGSDRGTA
ncbi:CU044_2847 family protein [Nonomuraea lactucae]|uniref:CU044_2847 family protein n=1 Tax=Nonomuraea lactucae TaxID=2249762 RepID=UPI0013B433EA|nr:CU044_2847 family protein [Nonomuraea lactucae]